VRPLDGGLALLMRLQASLQFAEGQLRGYVELTVTTASVQADFFGFYEQQTRNDNRTLVGTFV
jgi:alkaline phosphatase D